MGANEKEINSNVGLLENIGYGCYTNKEVWDLLLNKNSAKKMLNECGLNIPKTYLLNTNEKILFPIIVKPADCSGSNGVSLCLNKNELINKTGVCSKLSISNDYVIEEYLEGREIIADYTIINGKSKLSIIGDKLPNKRFGNFSPICDAYYYLSSLINIFNNKCDSKIKKFIKKNKIKNGVISFQAIFKNDEFYFFETGYRLPGTLTYLYTKEINGVSYLDNILDNALNIKINEKKLEKENAFFNVSCCSLSMLLKAVLFQK